MVLTLMRWALAAGAILIAAQALALGRVELTFDEAYYALWARWPQAGYYDHPPMVAWWIAASQSLFGPTEWGVRAPFWIAGAILPFLVFALGRRFYDTQTAATATLFYLGAPLVAGAPLATPDTPLVLFWALALLGLAQVWRGSPVGWALVGAASGAAGLSKMTAGFLGVGVALALVATPSLRRQFARPGLYGAAALALLVLSPFLWWNATHGYATFLKQGARLAARSLSPRYLSEFLGSQFLLVNPLTAALAARGLASLREKPSESTRLLLATCAPLLAYFLIHSLHDRVQGNWPAPLYPALALLAARAAGARGRAWAPASAATAVAAAGALYAHLATSWPDLGPADPTLRIGGWRALAAQVDALARARGAEVVEAQGYSATSLLSFYGSVPPEVIEVGEPQRWAFRPASQSHGKRLAFGPAGAQGLGVAIPGGVMSRRVGGETLETYWLSEIGAAPSCPAPCPTP